MTIAGVAPAEPRTEVVESKLTEDQDQLQVLLSKAPEPARAGLRQALDATERSRALVAEPTLANDLIAAAQAIVDALTISTHSGAPPGRPTRTNTATE